MIIGLPRRTTLTSFGDTKKSYASRSIVCTHENVFRGQIAARNPLFPSVGGSSFVLESLRFPTLKMTLKTKSLIIILYTIKGVFVKSMNGENVHFFGLIFVFFEKLHMKKRRGAKFPLGSGLFIQINLYARLHETRDLLERFCAGFISGEFFGCNVIYGVINACGCCTGRKELQYGFHIRIG